MAVTYVQTGYQGGHPAYPTINQIARYVEISDDTKLEATAKKLHANFNKKMDAASTQGDWHLKISGNKVSPSFPTIRGAVKHYVNNHFDSPDDVHLYNGASHVATYHAEPKK